jgi:CRP/FNR family transcriptional regulator
MSIMTKSEAFEHIPFFSTSSDKLKNELETISLFKVIPKGTFISLEGDRCNFISFVASGRARVYKLGESGREITLYRLETGESCILTASCILSQRTFPAIAVAETDIEAILVPSEIFRSWIKVHNEISDYVFNLLSDRLGAVIEMIEEIAFKNMDKRIAEFLINKKSHKNEVKLTHQEIAGELGTSREVVSRILKDFEHEQMVALSRGTIFIKNLDGLGTKAKKF